MFTQRCESVEEVRWVGRVYTNLGTKGQGRGYSGGTTEYNARILGVKRQTIDGN